MKLILYTLPDAAHNQSDRISFLIVDTLVSPSLLHDCQSERFVSLCFCRSGGSWLWEQDKVMSFFFSLLTFSFLRDQVHLHAWVGMPV